MQIIPVIDLKDGYVVRAVKGNRSEYEPIHSELTTSCKPVEVVSALLKLTQSNIIYIADLNAIEGSENNFKEILSISQEFETITLWIDAGFRSVQQLQFWEEINNFRPVIGTESHTDKTTLLPLLTEDSILSLDYKNKQLVGPEEIFGDVQFWPDDIIIMTLDNVGSNSGPDLNLFNQLKKITSTNNFFAAGGVRDDHDLTTLKKAGLAGVLVSTALHNQTISLD